MSHQATRLRVHVEYRNCDGNYFRMESLGGQVDGDGFVPCNGEGDGAAFDDAVAHFRRHATLQYAKVQADMQTTVVNGS